MKKLTLQYLADYAADEGLGYMIQDGINTDDIEDEEMKHLCKHANRLLNDITNILKKYNEYL